MISLYNKFIKHKFNFDIFISSDYNKRQGGQNMKVGFSIKKINPQVGCQMEGYNPRNSTGIHDDLTTSVLVLNKNFVIISLDLIAIPAFRVDRIKRRINEKYSINPDHIIISAIHTHSGPTVTDLLIDYPKIDNSYWKLIDEQVLKGIECALQNSSSSELKLIQYKVPNGIYANRNSESLPYNRSIMELRFTHNSTIRASLLFVATHPTVMNIKNTLISADLIEGIRQQYKKLHNLKPMVVLSDCADTSTRFTRKESSFKEIDRLAKLIGQSLTKPILEKTLNWKLNSIRNINEKCDYDPITNKIANKLYDLICFRYNKATSTNQKQMLKGLLDTYKHIRYYGHTHFTTHAMIYDFNDFRIVTYPGELVYALGDKIRNHDKKITLLITLANDYRGYSVDVGEFGKYFESYNSVFLKGMADDFVNQIVNQY